MNWHIYLIIGLCILLFLAGSFFTAGSPYTRATHLFTKAEVSFYRELVRAAGNDFVVFGKVRVADLVVVKSAGTRRRHMQALGRIAQKHVDFCLCYPHDLSVACVLELNDRSHERKDRIKRDDFIDQLFKKVKLPVVWVPVTKFYDSALIRQMINQAIIDSMNSTRQG